MKLRLALVTLLLATSVAASTADSVNNEIVRYITYIQDHRTNLCFAKYEEGFMEYKVAGIATVPCEQVKAMLLNP